MQGFERHPERTEVVRSMVRIAFTLSCTGGNLGDAIMADLGNNFGDTPDLRRELVEAVLDKLAAPVARRLLADAQRRRRRAPAIRKADAGRMRGMAGNGEAEGVDLEGVLCGLFVESAGYPADRADAILARMGIGEAHPGRP
jgi:hypothetical protein